MSRSTFSAHRLTAYTPWALAFAAALGAAPSWALSLNDSGLTQCQDASGEFTQVCQGSGQDAEFGRDTSAVDSDGAAGFRFTKVCHSGERAGHGNCPKDPALGADVNQWGCTRDEVTGILWEIKTDDGGLRDWHHSYTHKKVEPGGDGGRFDADTFVKAVNAEGLCGHHDWQLPTPTALQSLVHYGIGPREGVPTIDATYFPNTYYGANWSRTYAADGDSRSWFVHFDTNYVGRSDNTIYKRIRLARGDNHDAKPARYEVSADGQEVKDLRSGLIWRRCVEGQAWDGEHCTGTPATYTWRQALALGDGQAAGWRLPNAKELAWLADRTRVSPALDTAVFPDAPSGKHWTSTAILSTPTHAWHVEFDIGEVYRTTQKAALYARLVR
ncbi:DUF1566 domain-containing protein [Ideonella sp. DXS29W]|uniref:DUF1566 domain-containing protein n=1 Tax=Ideonella lacteola TaxID=2984193 RepID=A0ABU9BPC4_9BURK